MQPIVNFIREVLRFHKLKILATTGFVALFFVLLFPYSDLGNLVTTKIYDGSGQQLYVHADELKLSLIPLPGIQANRVAIEPGARGARFNALNFDELEIRPLLSALLSFRPGASVDATGIFGGSLSVSAKTSNTFFSAEPGVIDIGHFMLEDVSLSSIINYAMPAAGLKLGGKLFVESTGLRIDPTNKEPMSGDLALLLQSVALPTEIPIPGFGSINIPPIKIQKADFRTQLGKNKLRITNGTFGVEKDPLSGRILGEIDLRQTPQGIVPGTFNLCIELNVNQDFYNGLPKEYASILQGFSSMTEKYRRGEPGVKYGIRASGNELTQVAYWQTSPGDCKTMAGTQ